MLKKIWLLGGVLTIGAIVSVAAEQHRAREKYEAKSQEDCIALGVSSEEKHTCEKEAQSRKAYSPWWYVLVAFPEGITAWAIIATGFAIALQSVETKNAARAALLNAQAIINAERPWVVMVIERDKEEANLFLVKAVNRGRTPAKIVSGSNDCCVIRKGSEMSVPPEYRRTKRFPEGVLLVSGESQTIVPFSRAHLRMECWHDEETLNGVQTGSQIAVIFGNVVYEDLMNTPKDRVHETRWCSQFVPGNVAQDMASEAIDEMFLTRGAEGYTKHT